MGFLTSSLAATGIAWVAKRAYQNAMETKRRRSSVLAFEDGISQEEFIEMATSIARRTPRVIEVNVVGMTVDLRVKSNSGLTNWEAEIDFNDYGRLTGKYWLSADNSDSRVPEHFAKEVAIEISTRREASAGAGAQAETESHNDQYGIGESEAKQFAPPGWYPTEMGNRYWNGSTWI